MNEVLATQERFMTIADVANTMKTSEITIRRAIKELFPDLIQNGKMTKLTEAHVTAIKLRIEKNHPDKNVEVIRTDLEETLLIKQGYELLLCREKALSEENLLLKKENTEMTPKAEFYDQVTGSKTAIDMGHAAKVLDMGIGRNKMFQILRDKGVLMADNSPYQTYIDRGYFRIIEQKYVKPDGSTNISLKTVVYQRGLDYIRKAIGENK